jgi:hypothetical protein
MRFPVALAGLVCLAWTASARADGTSTDAQAHAAYERGTAAFRRGDFVTAAREYAAADALVPNPVALQAAIDAAIRADDPVVGATLLDHARASARTDGLVASMTTAERKFAHRTGRLVLACPAPPCLVAIDGAAAPPGVAIVVRVGSHTVTLEASGTVTTRVITVGADETLTVSSPAGLVSPAAPPAPVQPPAPPPAPPAVSPAVEPPRPAPVRPAPAHRGGLSPAWFWALTSATAVAGGVTIGSGVDTAERHATFARTCPGQPSCPRLGSEGQSAQTRTNVLVGVTAALGAATLVTALLVRWHGSGSAAVAAGPGTVWFDVRF